MQPASAKCPFVVTCKVATSGAVSLDMLNTRRHQTSQPRATNSSSKIQTCYLGFPPISSIRTITRLTMVKTMAIYLVTATDRTTRRELERLRQTFFDITQGQLVRYAAPSELSQIWC